MGNVLVIPTPFYFNDYSILEINMKMSIPKYFSVELNYTSKFGRKILCDLQIKVEF